MIKIGKEWGIDSDQQCVTIHKKTVTEKGEIRWRPMWYFNNFEQALMGLIDRDIQSQDTGEIGFLVSRIKDLKKEIKDALSHMHK